MKIILVFLLLSIFSCNKQNVVNTKKMVNRTDGYLEDDQSAKKNMVKDEDDEEGEEKEDCDDDKELTKEEVEKKIEDLSLDNNEEGCKLE